MIPASDHSWQHDDWRRILARAITDPLELLRRLELADHPLAARVDRASDFPVRVPEPLLACMRPGDPHDPVLRQVLALDAEREDASGFVADPLAERDANPVPGVLHKYRGRALLLATGGCAVHCRYCFRRHFPYDANNPGRAGLERALEHLAAQSDVEEIILSGGDPLLLDDEALARLLERLAEVARVRRVRIHTRFPVVIPQRLGDALAQVLTSTRLKPVMVLHVNHPRELEGGLAVRLDALRDAGIPLLNQAVLLAGVNDAVGTLAELGEALFDAGVVPYYLHLLDRVAGAAHFEVAEERARSLYDALAASQPGYLVPRLAREAPSAPGKQVLPPRW